MRNQVGNTTLAELHALDLAQLVLGLLAGDAVHSEATLGIVDETEVLASLLNADDVHETCGVCGVGADLAIDLDQALHDNGLDLTSIESVLQAVAEEDNERKTVAEFVRTSRGTGCVCSGELVKKPVGRR